MLTTGDTSPRSRILAKQWNQKWVSAAAGAAGPSGDKSVQPAFIVKNVTVPDNEMMVNYH